VTRLLAASVCVLTVLSSAPATGFASVFELFGAGPRSVAMAGALSGAAHGGEAAFHNPALLADASWGGVSLGASGSHFGLDVSLQRPICTEAYTTCRNLHGTSFASRAAKQPPSSTGMQFGWHAPLGGALRKRVVVAALMALPASRLIHISGPDPQTPHFYMYEGLPDRISVLLAASWQPLDWLSIGLGTQVLAALSSDIEIQMDATNHDMDFAAVRIDLQPVARLVAGIALRPARGLRLGVGYRQEISLRYEIPSRIGLGAAATADLQVEQNTLFSPSSLHFGASWRSPGGRLMLAVDLGLALWSSAPDPSPGVQIDVGGAIVDKAGLGTLIDVGQDASPIDLHFTDTWTPAAGAEWRALDRLVVRGGYAFRPSPAPRASGPFNYLDNAGHALGFGLEWGFGGAIANRPTGAGNRQEPLRIDHPLSIRLGGQWLILARRTVRKMDANDPVGDYEHGGSVLHWTAAVAGTY